jgi:hypothetical protein
MVRWCRDVAASVLAEEDVALYVIEDVRGRSEVERRVRRAETCYV